MRGLRPVQSRKREAGVFLVASRLAPCRVRSLEAVALILTGVGIVVVRRIWSWI